MEPKHGVGGVLPLNRRQQRVARHTKRLRLAHGWTQATLAAKLGVRRPYVAQIESGARGVSIEILAKLAKAFRVKAGSFLD